MFTDINKAFHWMESFTNMEKGSGFEKREYRLDRMEALSRLFQNPHKSYKCIHVAGSKGKGSTCVFLASILHEAGFTTGLYASPHLVSYTERFKINGQEGDKEILLELINTIHVKLDELAPGTLPGGDSPTTFELLTLLSFLFFEKMQCQWVVLETGLGGRLDATNIVTPKACVLTPIELEHTQFLGDNIESIAGEKAGIIKENIPVFSSQQPFEALEVFKKRCEEKNAPFHYLQDDIQPLTKGFSSIKRFEQKVQFTHRHSGKKNSFRLKLLGEKQADNSALAYYTLQTLIPELPLNVFKSGLKKASLPGRMEPVSLNPLIFLDAAHTRNSVRMTLRTFQMLSQNRESLLIFGCAEDKDHKSMAAVLADHFKTIIITTPGHFKASRTEEVYNAFLQKNPGTILIPEPLEAYTHAVSLAGTNGAILICGSFYLAGEIKASF